MFRHANQLYNAIVTLLIFITIVVSDQEPGCEIYCDGPLLDVVQMSRLYPDCKEFVDMKMKFPVKEIMTKFHTMMNETDNHPPKPAVRRFVRQCFAAPGSELIRHVPSDWVERPSFLEKIFDYSLRDWAEELNYLWRRLARRTKHDVGRNRNMYSIIDVPNPFIIPGDRFREIVYWDSYWIILGLVRSEMYTTTKGMLENFIYLVKKYGYVPNGGRIYYLQRSNLPLLIPMVSLYYHSTNDSKFLQSNTDILAKEFDYWLKTHMVEVKTEKNNAVQLARYTVSGNRPRPESYVLDTTMAGTVRSDTVRDRIHSEIKAACESGWNFSSRWQKNIGRIFSFGDIEATDILPVDLNAVLCWNAEILSQMYEIISEKDKASRYREIADALRQAVTDMMWDDNEGSWFDYDFHQKTQRKHFYASNLVPLWAGCYDKERKSHIGKKVMAYIRKNGLLDFKGGIPSSLVYTGEQWDAPNAFPPMQHIIITGLRNIDELEAREMAYNLSFNWVRSNYAAYVLTKSMFSKYDANNFGTAAESGRIPTQVGYGWTNGICIDLLCRYGAVLHAEGISVAFRLHPLSVSIEIIISVYIIFFKPITALYQ